MINSIIKAEGIRSKAQVGAKQRSSEKCGGVRHKAAGNRKM
jgi:hypothetical protein